MSIPHLLEAIAARATAAPKRTVLLALLLCTVLASAALGLRFDPNPSSMLPPGSPALEGLNLLVERFGAGDQLFLAIEAPDAEPETRERVRAEIERLAEAVRTWSWESPTGPEPMIGLIIGRQDPSLQEAREDLIGRAGFLSLSDAGIEDAARRLQPRYVEARLERGPGAAVPAELRRRDVLGLWSYVYADDILTRLGNDLPLRQEQGYLVSQDDRIHVLMLKPKRPIKDMPFTHAISDALTQLQREFAATHTHLTLHVAGGYPLASRDFKTAQRSAVMMAATSFLGIMLLFGLVYRSLRLVGFIAAVVVPSVAASLGVASLLFGGELSLVVSAFTAILVGLGVDYIIHLYNAYAWALHHDTQTHDSPRARRAWAARQATHRVGPGILLGCVTSVTAFAVLALAEFRGMQELGVVSALGLALMLLLVILLIPALLTLAGPDECDEPRLLRTYVRRLSDRPWPFVTISIALALLVAGVLLSRDQIFRFDHDLRNLRPVESVRERDYVQLGKRLGISFGGLELLWAGQDPEALLNAAWDFDQSLEPLRRSIPCQSTTTITRAGIITGIERLPVQCAAAGEQLLARHVISTPWGEATFEGLVDGALTQVRLRRHWDAPPEPLQLPAASPLPILPLLHPGSGQLSLLPSPARQRTVLAQFQAAVDWPGVMMVLREASPEQRRHYAPFFEDMRHMHERIQAGEPLLPYDLLDSPLAELVRARCVLGEDGTAYLRMPLALRPDHSLVPFAELYRAINYQPGPDGVDTHAAGVQLRLVGGVALAYELQSTIVDNFVYLTLLAGVAILVLLTLSMRHIGNILMVIGTLGFGVALMLTGMHVLGLRWNIINIAVLPLIIGIGIDNGIHFIHHLSRQSRCRNGLSRTLIEIGHPITMTTLTSMVGFGALMVNAYQGISGLGLLGCLGLLACMLSTLLVLPALLVSTHYKPPPDPEQDPLSQVRPAVSPRE